RLRRRGFVVSADGVGPLRLCRPVLVAGAGAGRDEYLPGLEQGRGQHPRGLAQSGLGLPGRQAVKGADMKNTMIGGALRRTALAVACLAAGTLHAAAANRAVAANESL